VIVLGEGGNTILGAIDVLLLLVNESDESRDMRRCRGLAAGVVLEEFESDCVGETDPCSRFGGMGGGVPSPDVLPPESGRCGFGGGLGNSFVILGGKAGEVDAELLLSATPPSGTRAKVGVTGAERGPDLISNDDKEAVFWWLPSAVHS
jgi:hypothetical protein